LSLQVDSRPVAVKLKTEGKEKPAGKTDKQIKAEEKARKSEERKKAREAFQEKTLEELKQEEAKSEKLIEQFEKQALAEAVKNVKNTSLVQVGEKIFQVTKKADGVFSVSQMREDGKMVGIKDEKSRKEAISAFNQEKGKKENEELAKAQKLIEDFKNEEKDRFEALLDKAINSLSSKGRAFDATIGLPIFVAKSALQIIKVGYKAGKSLKEAIDDGYKYIKDMGYVSVSEFDFKQYVLSELTNKPKEKEAKEQKAEVKEQEFTENVLEIAKETGLSPQQIENTYKKYDGSKNIEEITIEDYNNARATGDKAKLEVSAKAFDALLQQESAKTATSPTANKNAKESLKGVDEKALKEASKIMEHINDIRANLQEFKIIESTSCKWGK
jgi:methylphosphotriester-DNA--protein-cysteine methyltransferase